MPEVLELKPLKEKVLKLIMVESEFPIEWWFEVPKDIKEDLVWNLHLISKEFLQLIDSLIEKYKPDFGLEERPNFWDDPLNPNDPLKTLFEKKGIPFKHADISENAEFYLSAALDEHRKMLINLEAKIKETLKKRGTMPENDELFQQLILWKEYLQKDYDKQEDEVRYKVREAWMMMNILNSAKDINGKKLKGMFICDNRHFEGLEKLAEELGIETEQVRIKRTIKTEEVEEELEKEVEIEFKK
ncbi:MAG: hypothetical protein ACFFKA_02570 [Candidatus Thorarchaeota archaeon]